MSLFPLKKKESCSLSIIAFLQATGLAVYCSLIALLFWEKQQKTQALKLVAHTSAWLIIYLLALMIILLVF